MNKRVANKLYNKVFKFVVFTITILTANLLGDFLSDYLTSFKQLYRPIGFTLMAMFVIVLIFYPAFEILEMWINKLSMNIVKTGKSYAGKYTGLFLAFFVSLLVLTALYVKMWYNINIFDYLFMGKAKLLYYI
jgi:hypothetical protein